MLSKGWDWIAKSFISFADHAADRPLTPEQKALMKMSGKSAKELKSEAQKALGRDPQSFVSPSIIERMKRESNAQMLYENEQGFLYSQAGGGSVVTPTIINNYHETNNNSEAIFQELKYNSDSYNLHPHDQLVAG